MDSSPDPVDRDYGNYLVEKAEAGDDFDDLDNGWLLACLLGSGLPPGTAASPPDSGDAPGIAPSTPGCGVPPGTAPSPPGSGVPPCSTGRAQPRLKPTKYGRCQKCARALQIVSSPLLPGPMLGCPDYLSCGHTPQALAMEDLQETKWGRCPKCAKALQPVVLDRGPFLGCPSYSSCGHRLQELTRRQWRALPRMVLNEWPVEWCAVSSRKRPRRL